MCPCARKTACLVGQWVWTGCDGSEGEGAQGVCDSQDVAAGDDARTAERRERRVNQVQT